MGEYLPTNDGRPLKTTDAMLDKISELVAVRDALIIEVAVLRGVETHDRTYSSATV